MFRFEVLFFLTCLNTLHGDKLLGEGLWSTIQFGKCSDERLRQETLTLDVNKHKLNRTLDAMSAHAVLTKEITESYWVLIQICKIVDGGCKPYLTLYDSVGHLCDKYAKASVIQALQNSTFDTDYFPLPKGEYDLYDYVFDYCTLPPVCPYGKYEILIYLVFNLQRIACVKLVAECKKCEEVEYCCDR